jgi:hypothetical protein
MVERLTFDRWALVLQVADKRPPFHPLTLSGSRITGPLPADCWANSRLASRIMVGPGLEDTRFTKADLIHNVLSENEASPGDAIVIGDRAADIVGARANGVRSIGVTWGYGEPEELADADEVVDSWTELVICLQRAA